MKLPPHEFWLHVLSAVGSAAYMILASSPNPAVVVVTQVVAAVYGLSQIYYKTKQLSASDLDPALTAIQAALAEFKKTQAATLNQAPGTHTLVLTSTEKQTPP